MAASRGLAHVAAIWSATLTIPIPMSFLGCIASSVVSARRGPITNLFTPVCNFSSCFVTTCWSCGTVYCSVALAFPSTLPAACAVRPLLPYGMAPVARLSARCTASVTLAFHSSSAPAALPSMMPCHLSGMRMGPSALISCVRVSPLSLSCLAASVSPFTSKPPCLPRSSSIVLSTFILWFDMRSNRSSVSRSGGTDSGPLTATMMSSTSPRSLIVGPSSDGAWPSKCGIGIPLILSSSRSMRICTSCTYIYRSGLRGQP